MNSWITFGYVSSYLHITQCMVNKQVNFTSIQQADFLFYGNNMLCKKAYNIYKMWHYNRCIGNSIKWYAGCLQIQESKENFSVTM